MANPAPQTKGGKPDKLIRDALLAASRQNPNSLKRVAEAILQKAMDGDVAAFKEIADRIDGKVAQGIKNEDGEAFVMRAVSLTDEQIINNYLERQKNELQITTEGLGD